MVQTRGGAWRHKLAVGLVFSTMVLAGLGLSPADATHRVVTEVEGSAYGCFGSTTFDFDPAPPDPDPVVTGPIAEVTLPEGGSATPVTATAPECEMYAFPEGPAVFTSGPLSTSTQGTTGPTGSVTSTVTLGPVNTSGVENFTAANVSSSCTANEDGVTGTTTITGGVVHGETDVPVPVNPEPNTVIPVSIGFASYNYIFNEQIVAPDGTLTVNAVRIEPVTGPLQGTVIAGQVVCGVTTVAAPTTTTEATTTTTEATTTTTEATTTTSTPASTTTSTPPQGGRVQIDDLALSDGEVVRITGTITCDAGDRYRMRVEVTQGETDGRALITGNCTGEPQRFRAILGARSGPGFEDGTAQVRITGQIGDPDTRTIEDRFTTSDDVQIDVRDGMAAAL